MRHLLPRPRACVLALLMALPVPGFAQTPDCGTADTPCQLDGGDYFLSLPDSGEVRAIVLWLHGYGGSGARAAANTGFTRNFHEAGFAFVAPHGQAFWPDGKDRRDWGVRDGFAAPRDDAAFLLAVLDDAAARLDLIDAPVLLAGFSRGGSMAWDLACAQPGRLAGVAPVSGGFWEPMATECAGPVHLFHTHGFSDRMVPLEGRKATWQGHEFHQGSIFKGLDVWREVNGCMLAADQSDAGDAIWEKRWTGCAAGSITLQIVPGGHGIPRGWSSRVIEWFATLENGQG